MFKVEYHVYYFTCYLYCHDKYRDNYPWAAEGQKHRDTWLFHLALLSATLCDTFCDTFCDNLARSVTFMTLCHSSVTECVSPVCTFVWAELGCLLWRNTAWNNLEITVTVTSSSGITYWCLCGSATWGKDERKQEKMGKLGAQKEEPNALQVDKIRKK